MARFGPLEMTSDPTTWGPSRIPQEFEYLPNLTFERKPINGKIVDWTGYLRFNGKYSQGGHLLTQQGGGGGEGEQEKFEMVGGLKQVKPQHKSLAQRTRAQTQARQRQMAVRQAARTTSGITTTHPGGGGNRRFFRGGFHNRRFQYNRVVKEREASIDIKPTWNMIEEMDFSRMQKLTWRDPGPGEDVARAGELEAYDATVDRSNVRNPRTLRKTTVPLFFHSKTTQDRILRELTPLPEYKVIATDRVISAIMACTRSVYPFHIHCTRVADKLILEKGDDKRLDYFAVNETAADTPVDDAKALNGAKLLSQEATLVHHCFVQQALRHDTRKLKFEKPVPIVVAAARADDTDDEQQQAATAQQQQQGEQQQQQQQVPTFAYKYRKFTIDEDKKLTMLVRCTVDAYVPGATPEAKAQQINIHTLTEWDPFNAVNINWRQKLEGQFAAVLATEVKNNSFRIARWTLSSLLANVDLVRLAFVSRINFRDPNSHVITSVQPFRPTEFMQNINLNVENAWGVLNYILKRCLEQPPGEYLLIKDPNKAAVRLFALPSEEDAETDGDDEESDDDDDDVVGAEPGAEAADAEGAAADADDVE